MNGHNAENQSDGARQGLHPDFIILMSPFCFATALQFSFEFAKALIYIFTATGRVPCGSEISPMRVESSLTMPAVPVVLSNAPREKLNR
jgi:hypothetical protein